MDSNLSPSVSRLDNGTIELHLTIPWTEIQAAYEQEVEKAIADAELPGFRKGKAPRNLVETRLDKNQLYSHAVQHLLPEKYAKLIKDNNIKPILYPQIRIDKGEEGHDWEFTATTCEAPEVKIDDLKAMVTGIAAEPADTKLARIITAIREKAKVHIPDMLIEEEANHRISSLAENITKLGLNTDSYLQTKKLTPEELKSQIAQEARADLEIEFILASIQAKEKLTDRKQVLDFLTKLV